MGSLNGAASEPLKNSSKSELPPLRISSNLIKDASQIDIHQSITHLAHRDKDRLNSTASPDTLHTKFFGFPVEDITLFVGAVVGALLVVIVCILILSLWKCCSRMTILGKKKEYWLERTDASRTKGRYKTPVVKNNAVVFLGLRQTQPFDYKSEKSSEDCSALSKEEDFRTTSFCNPLHSTMSLQCSELILSDDKKDMKFELPQIQNHANISMNQSCSVISVPPFLDHCTQSTLLSSNIPNVIIHRDSPVRFHRSFCSGTFDQHSLYSCNSHGGSDITLKKASSFTYSMRPPSDCYYDLFQKASFCKKRKNRMRSDIAAAIALNRSESSQLNKDTELLVENEIEVISNERTTL